MATNIGNFNTKLAITQPISDIHDTAMDVARNRGLFRSSNLTPMMKFTSDRPPLPW